MQNAENQKNLRRPYNIGLDIGTASVGWAVIDENYKIIKKGNKQKPLWGVYLFESADTAAERRKFRSTRRRYDRRKKRIKLLQEIFKDEIDKVDPNFFKKLEKSFYHDEDKPNDARISKEEIKKISAYRKKYPTIYHLRKKLLTSTEKEDIRLVYLAIHHIIKYRGNFNNNDLENIDDINNLEITSKLNELLNLIYNNCKDLYDLLDSNIDEDIIAQIEEALLDDSKTKKKESLEKYFKEIFPLNITKALTNSLIGNKFDVGNLFAIELDKKYVLNLTSSDFEKKIYEIEELNDNQYDILLKIKELYNIIQLKKILKNCNSISDLMVEYYENNKRDLKVLRKLLKKSNNDFYKQVFVNNTTNSEDENEELDDKKSNKFCLYVDYIKNNITYADFSTKLIKILNRIKNTENEKIISDIKDRLDKETYLKRINDPTNSIYPYQLNEAELKLIIKNQGEANNGYKFLTEKINGEYKLIKLLKFRIPYYVGPLASSSQSSFAWMKRKSDGKITQFNFEEKVDLNESAKLFIERMIGHCTYLVAKDKETGKYKYLAMPSNSIYYSKFKVLNELKQIKICNKSIRYDKNFLLKIYREFFLTKGTNVTKTEFLKYLRTKDELSMYIDKDSIDIDNDNVTGYSGDNGFANNMQSYIDFFGKNGIFKDTDLKEEDAEKIIELITLFEDKKILKEEILEKYPILESRIDDIISKKYKGWSNLSKELLSKPYYKDKVTGIYKSIMNLMEETSENFMQILNNKDYHFWDMIKEINNEEKDSDEFNYDNLVSDLVASPSVKKGIWQALKIVKEITDYMGYNPNYISIEMTRNDGKKERTTNRKDSLIELYQKYKEDIDDYNRLMEELNSKDRKDFDDEKLFLYFLQCGKSLYSMEKLNIDSLSIDCDVDHIIPRCLIKDDSFDNKALVLKEENSTKGDSLIIDGKVRKAMIEWWTILRKNGFITKKKYDKLIRAKFSYEDVNRFINRQLVETSQITLHVANILKNLYQNSDIIYIKSRISSDYRNKFEIYKYRDLNDYHHAHDAYLAVALGFYQKKKIRIEMEKDEYENLIESERKKEKNLDNGYIINSIQDSKIIDTINTTLYRNDIEVVRKQEFTKGKNKSNFFAITKYSHNSVKAKYEIKDNLSVEKYGGYTNYTYSYMIIVEYKVKNKIKKTLIGIPLISISSKDKDKSIDDYIKKNLKCDEYTIIKDKIPFNTEIMFENQKCVIRSCSNDRSEIINNHEFKLEKEVAYKYRYLLNYIFNKKYPKYNRDGFSNSNEYRKYWNEIFDKQINELFDLILLKMKNEYPLYSSTLDKLENVKALGIFYNLKFIKNDKDDKDDKEKSKLDIILELFKLLKCAPINANLKVLENKLTDREGRVQKKNINGIIIQKSPTGLKVRKYEF